MSGPSKVRLGTQFDCNCDCHDMNGGPYHRNQRCICNGGEGYDGPDDYKLDSKGQWHYVERLANPQRKEA